MLVQLSPPPMQISVGWSCTFSPQCWATLPSPCDSTPSTWCSLPQYPSSSLSSSPWKLGHLLLCLYASCKLPSKCHCLQGVRSSVHVHDTYTHTYKLTMMSQNLSWCSNTQICPSKDVTMTATQGCSSVCCRNEVLANAHRWSRSQLGHPRGSLTILNIDNIPTIVESSFGKTNFLSAA